MHFRNGPCGKSQMTDSFCAVLESISDWIRTGKNVRIGISQGKGKKIKHLKTQSDYLNHHFQCEKIGIPNKKKFKKLYYVSNEILSSLKIVVI